jgi:hypothetical protein
MLKKLPDVMVVILNTWFIEDKSPCNGLSFCMLVSSIAIEINILLIDQILDHFKYIATEPKAKFVFRVTAMLCSLHENDLS